MTTTQHRQVSLANIATAFLTERKSTTRRQSNTRMKKRLTNKDRKTSASKYQSNYQNGNKNVIGQRSSLQNMQDGIASIFVNNTNATHVNKKHRTTAVKRKKN